MNGLAQDTLPTQSDLKLHVCTRNAMTKRDTPILPRIARISFGLAFISVSLVVLAALGTRWEWWGFRTGLLVLKIGGYSSAFAAAACFVGAVWSGLSGARFGFALTLIGLLSCLTISVNLWYWKNAAETVPRIHDITTDTENPPLFKAILPIRKDAPNPAEYGGPQIAALQRTGYPDLAPLLLPANTNEAFQKALSTAVKMGWEIVEANQADGRIEATDTTLWFGFKDDIIVRITSDKTGSRVDIRSVSRVGLSDVGTNAKRIRNFLARVRQ